MKIICGIDPGSGSSSALGLAIYNADEQVLLEAIEIWADPSAQKPTWRRIQSIVANFIVQLGNLESALIPPHSTVEVRSESFVMRGPGGPTLQRVIGGVLTAIKPGWDFREVHNIQLKVDLTGNSKASKAEMGEGLKKRLPKSEKLIQYLIDKGMWDAIDAACIACCGRVLEQ